MAAPLYVWRAPGAFLYEQSDPPVTGEDCTTNRAYAFLSTFEMDRSAMGLLSTGFPGSPDRIRVSGYTHSSPNTLPVQPPGYDAMGFTFDMDFEAYYCFSGVEKKLTQTLGFFWIPDQLPTVTRACDASCEASFSVPPAYRVKRVRVSVTVMWVNPETLSYTTFANCYDSGVITAFKAGSTTILEYPGATFTLGGLTEAAALSITVTQDFDTNPNSVGGTQRVTGTRQFTQRIASCGLSTQDCGYDTSAPSPRDTFPVDCEADVAPPGPPPPTEEIPEPYDYIVPGYEANFLVGGGYGILIDADPGDETSYATLNDSHIPGQASLEGSWTAALDYRVPVVIPAGSIIYVSGFLTTSYGYGSSVALDVHAKLDYCVTMGDWDLVSEHIPPVTNLPTDGTPVWFHYSIDVDEEIALQYLRFTGVFTLTGFMTPGASLLAGLSTNISELRIVTP